MRKKNNKTNNIMKLMIFFVVILLLPSVVSAANIYVDQQLGSDCTSGDYSIANRNCNGADGNAYDTVQEAINVVGAGDTIFMRGGTYNEHIVMPGGKKGTANNPIIWRSYPGEWAILDGSSGSGAVIYNSAAGLGSGQCPEYWIIRNFEITGGSAGGGGNEYGGGINLDTARHITFMYLYIHDNTGSSGMNDGGIVIQNEDITAQYITVKYSLLQDTTCTNDGNCRTISFFSDYNGYGDPPTNNFAGSRHDNEVAYNRVIGGVQGISSKAWQVLTFDHTAAGGDNPASYYQYEDRGDKIHHNIVTNVGIGLELRQDFIQAYSNIIEITSAPLGDELIGCIVAGGQEYNTDREPFYAVLYNNLCIGSDLTVEHQGTGIYGGTIHPYSYVYNNIIESSTIHMGNRRPFTVAYGQSSVDMDSVTFENNLILPNSRDTSVIRMGGTSSSINQFISSGHSSIIYNSASTSGLHPTGYNINTGFSLGGTTIANGGVSINHPYLSGIQIPSYVGPAKPNDDAWINGVMNINVAWLTAQTGDEDPAWVEGAGPSTCPDGICDAGECNTCPSDCNFNDCCPDEICNNEETCSSCSTDCTTPAGSVCCLGNVYPGDCCVNSDCSGSEVCNPSHQCTAAPQCGDGSCDTGAGETCVSCVSDCGTCGSTITVEFGDHQGSNYPGTVEDTYIDVGTANQNYATDTHLNTYTWPANTIANAIIIKWNLNAIPESATITSASLQLYMDSMEGTGGDVLYDISAHKMINVNPTISTCTWDSPWIPSSGAQNDIASAEDTIQVDKTYNYKTWSVTNMVQDWVNNPSTNYGMLINSDPIASVDSNRIFASSENTNTNQRPKLVITYSAQQIYHEADTNPPYDCIDMIELIAYIGRWKNNDGVGMTSLIEAIGIWKAGGC